MLLVIVHANGLTRSPSLALPQQDELMFGFTHIDVAMWQPSSAAGRAS